MSERNPEGYKFKHPKKIYLDGYYGVGNGIMELNDPVADGFMRTSDMRSDIAIIQKPHNRVQDYDQIGNVRVAKFLQLPKLELWKKDKLLYTRKEDDTYQLAIDDQELSNEVTDSNDGTRKFDELFVERFKQEVARGLSGILRKEKLLNGGKYDLTFLVSYAHSIAIDGIFLPTTLAAQYAAGMLNLETLGQTVGITAMFHTLQNGTNFAFAVINDWFVSKGLGGNLLFEEHLGATWKAPFVKHTLPDSILPPVPLDRILRGEFYLHRKGHKLIEAVK